MGELKKVLARLDRDPEFRVRLLEDPAAALDAYDLTTVELESLARVVEADTSTDPASDDPHESGFARLFRSRPPH